jgi:hypothetical protein
MRIEGDPPMPDITDLGGAPAEEDCAQLGHTPDFDAVNAYEVFAYKLAIIARYGQPPAGCRLKPLANRHDFGVYRTLSLRIDDEADEAVQAYAEAVEEGLARWPGSLFLDDDDALSLQRRGARMGSRADRDRRAEARAHQGRPVRHLRPATVRPAIDPDTRRKKRDRPQSRKLAQPAPARAAG